MKRTIKVTDMRNLKEGDVVLLPKATVTRRDPFDAVRLEFDGGEEAWIHPDRVVGINVTREVEPEFNLTWAEALEAMVTHGKVCASEGDLPWCWYRYKGRFEYQSLDGRWHLWSSPSRTDAEYKWCVVEEAE